jgi:hypothetical protein
MVLDVLMSVTSLSLYYRSIEAQMCPKPTVHGILIEVESGGRGGEYTSFHDRSDLSVSKLSCHGHGAW